MITGFWTADGNQYLDRYSDPVYQEHIVTLQLSVLPDQESQARREVVNAVAEVKKAFALDCRHVHMETVRVEAHHFTV